MGEQQIVPYHSREAKFQIGQVVKHRLFSFRGVIFDVDPVFANTEEWWLSIPEEIRPTKDQPFYHLFAENDETEYVAYVSEQNLLADETREPIHHPKVHDYFDRYDRNIGAYRLRMARAN
jgi:heat shock protein HspQ